MGVWTYDHDALGHMIEVANPNNQLSFLQYDTLGRLHTRYIRGYTFRWIYNDTVSGSKGRLKYEAKYDSNSDELSYKKLYTYDDRARVSSEIEKIFVADGYALRNYTTKMSYYDNNKLKDLTYPNNLTIRHYYKNGYLYKIDSTNEFGKIATATMYGDLQEIYSYNSAGLLINQVANDASGEKISLSYSYDERGNLHTKEDAYIDSSGLKEVYSYDNLNRLTRVDVTSSHISSKDKTLTYSYDTQGNLLKDDRHTFKYDPLDQVVSITQNSKSTTFDYTPSGSRYQKHSNDNWAYTHYIGKLYEESKDNITTENRVEKNFIYFGSKLIAIKQREITTSPKEPDLKLIEQDNLGNIIAILDNNLNIIERRSYKPFGEIRSIAYKEQLDHIPTLIERLKHTNRSYTGHEYINGTDLIHMNGRVYDTITSRFVSADPFIQAPDNLQSYNRYSYVLNNPVNLTDPSGYLFSGWGHAWHKAKRRVHKAYKDTKHWLQDHRDDVKQAVVIAIAVVTTTASGGAAASRMGRVFLICRNWCSHRCCKWCYHDRYC